MNRQTLTRLQCFGTFFCLLATAGCTEHTSLTAVAADAGSTSDASVDTTTETEGFSFEPPVRFTTHEGPVRVEAPGYASPCWADLDGDGVPSLLVGQFRGGKIRVFKSLGNEQLAEGDWLLAEGSVAEVPGVW